MSATALVVDDDSALRTVVAQDLEDLELEVLTASQPLEALELLRSREVDLVLTDVRMPGQSGTWLCQELTSQHPHIPVIVMTGFGSMEVAVEALRAGAYDFLSKPFKAAELEAAIHRALEVVEMRRELRRLRRLVQSKRGYGALIGQSAPMQRVYDLIDRVAISNASVLIKGESGVGKELVARAIHQSSRASSGPFIAFNCAALPQDLVESELFGHREGAFSGAVRGRQGLFREADGGVLFIDEIGELPLSAQPKLLRALQERKVRPVGADQEVPYDARVLAATHRDLQAGVQGGDFRADLYYRLAVVVLEVPPLRDRRDDVLLLAEHFLEQIEAREDHPSVELGRGVAATLLGYDWPGNVRELQNAIEHAFMMSRGQGEIEVAHLPELVRQRAQPVPISEEATPSLPVAMASLETVERRHIEQVMDLVEGNKSQAAKVLGIDRKTLRAKLKKYEL